MHFPWQVMRGISALHLILKGNISEIFEAGKEKGSQETPLRFFHPSVVIIACLQSAAARNKILNNSSAAICCIICSLVRPVEETKLKHICNLKIVL